MNSAIERLVRLRVSDVMQRNVVDLSASGSMCQAADTLLEHDVSGAPVVDEKGHCIGVLSATDFVRWTQALQHAENSDVRGRCHQINKRSAEGSLMGEEAPDGEIQAHMTAAVQSISADDWLTTAARRMCAAHVHRLPVLDATGCVVGLISSLDIVAALIGAIEE